MSFIYRFRRLGLLFVLPQLLFIIVAILTEDMLLKSVLNMIKIAIAAGICAAYLPGAAQFVISEDPIEAGDWLGFGIVLTWTASFSATLFSIIWLAHGQPLSWVNTDLTNYINYMYVCGGLCHLFAPGALKQRIPARRWIQFGIVIAGATFLGFVVAYAADVQIDWNAVLSGPHDLPTPRGL